ESVHRDDPRRSLRTERTWGDLPCGLHSRAEVRLERGASLAPLAGIQRALSAAVDRARVAAQAERRAEEGIADEEQWRAAVSTSDAVCDSSSLFFSEVHAMSEIKISILGTGTGTC